MSQTPKFLSSFSSIGLSASTALDALQQIGNIGLNEGLVMASWPDAVLAREKEFPTGLPTPIAVAIPHTDSVHVSADGIGFFRLSHPVSFGEMGSTEQFIDVQIVIPLLITDHEKQVDLLMTVIAAVQDEEFVAKLNIAADIDAVAKLFASKNL
jgi:PTS system galactitol-specific IIA component